MKIKLSITLFLVVMMLLLTTTVASARIKNGEQHWNYCGIWTETMPGMNEGNGMCPQ